MDNFDNSKPADSSADQPGDKPQPTSTSGKHLEAAPHDLAAGHRRVSRVRKLVKDLQF